jgi:predicted dienelactone hydrolase
LASLLGGGLHQSIKKNLATPYSISASEAATVLREPMLQDLFRWLGEIFQTETGENGSRSIQQALVASSARANSVSLLSLVKDFPGEEIQVDADHALELFSKLLHLKHRTNDVIRVMREGYPPGDLPETPAQDLLASGSFATTTRTLRFFDKARDRSLDVDLILPEVIQDHPALKLIIISHGLGSNRQYYGYVAQHMASHGYAVAAIQHPGSDSIRMHQFIEGQWSSVFDVGEFIDRPRDVTFILNQLEQIKNSTVHSQIMTDRVGVFGNSFGGYTALALAGANFDRAQLVHDCDRLTTSLNLSLLLQCRALSLPHLNDQLRDERVSAVLAINPLNSSIFGQNGIKRIKIPVLLAASAEDIVTPALIEQVPAFQWVSSQSRYLAMAEAVTHVVGESRGGGIKDIMSMLISPAPSALVKYDQALSLAFFGRYLGDELGFESNLKGTYARSISQSPYELYLSGMSTLGQLERLLE